MYLFIFTISILNWSSAVDFEDVDVYGEVDLNVFLNDGVHERHRAYNVLKREDMDELLNKVPDNCTYHYPDKDQVEKVLSYMTNELTKVFIRTGKYLELEAKRHKNYRTAKRFRTVFSKKTQFFENIFQEMVDNYTDYFNATQERVLRTKTAQCPDEKEIKKVWQELMFHSQQDLEGSFQRCVREYVGLQGSGDSETSKKLNNFIEQVVMKIRTKQSELLCKQYKLCFSDFK